MNSGANCFVGVLTVIRRFTLRCVAAVSLAALCGILPTPVAWAVVPASVVAVGGLAPYATEEFVKSVYGEPTYKTMLSGGEILFAYGASTSIYFSTEKRLTNIITGRDDGSDELYMIRRIDTVKGSGFVTPGGIGIGDDEAKILRIYGKPDVRVITGEDFDVRIMYVGEARSEDEGLCFMTFFLKEGRVAKISCYATRH